MTTLVLDGIRKRIGDVVALDGVDLTVEDGELLTLVGPQGAGSTTLLRVAAGRESPDAGAVRVGGTDVTGQKPDRRGVVLMDPLDELPENRTGDQIIRDAARGRGVRRKEVPVRATEAVSLARCAAALPHKPARLTLEGRRRVLIARALAGRPEVLLLDEPLIGLDEGARGRLLPDLRAAHARTGRTTVYAASDVAEAFAVGGRVAVLRAGAVEQVGTPEELYDDPRSRFVAEFVGSPMLNVVPVFVRSGRLHAGPFSFAVRGDDERHAERPLEMGIRPEHITVAPPRGGSVATITDVEMTPSGAYLHLEAGEDLLVMRGGPGVRPKVGSTVRIAVRRARTHLFDAETGETYPNPG